MNTQLQAPTVLPRGKDPPVSIQYETGCASQLVPTFRRRETFSTPAEKGNTIPRSSCP